MYFMFAILFFFTGIRGVGMMFQSSKESYLEKFSFLSFLKKKTAMF